MKASPPGSLSGVDTMALFLLLLLSTLVRSATLGGFPFNPIESALMAALGGGFLPWSWLALPALPLAILGLHLFNALKKQGVWFAAGRKIPRLVGETLLLSSILLFLARILAGPVAPLTGSGTASGWALAGFAASAAFYEELLFRFFLLGLLPVVAPEAVRVRVQQALIVVSALLFAQYHAGSFSGLAPFPLVAGLTLGLVYFFRGLAPCLLGHFFHDLVILAAPGFE